MRNTQKEMLFSTIQDKVVNATCLAEVITKAAYSHKADVSDVVAPTGVIDFDTYLRSRDGKAHLESWLKERMKEELEMDDVSLFIENPYSRISTKFDALSYNRQKELLEYISFLYNSKCRE